MSMKPNEAGTVRSASDAPTARRGFLRTLAHRSTAAAPELPDEGRLGPLARATGWLNSPPLTPERLRGQVVLVDFWTYTCVNWLRTLPYLRAWDEKYRSHGLAIVGVHTPEFRFERDPANVTFECAKLGVTYPVALDAHYGVWEDYANHYWPALYLADAQGRIRYHHFGEEEYAATEMAIQQLLIARGEEIDTDLVEVDPTGLELPANWRTLRSPETYLGFGRSDPSAPGWDRLIDRPEDFAPRDSLPLNGWDLQGRWTVTSDAVRLEESDGSIRVNFHARDVNLVMQSRTGAGVSFTLRLDGGPIDGSAGADVRADGQGEVIRPGTYQLIRQVAAPEDCTLEIEFASPGVEAFCFTFG